MVSNLAVYLAIFLGGVCAGILNSVAGGGTLVSYPILLWVGRDPIIANATNSLALWPGSLAGAWGLRREIAAVPRLLKVLVPAAILGGVAGGALLLATPSKLFAAFVPYLILFATAVLAGKPLLTRKPSQGPRPSDGGPKPSETGRLSAHLTAQGTSASEAKSGTRTAVLFVAQVLVSLYGGYFGAGMGILMLAALGLYGLTNFHERNAVKNLLAATTNGVASIFFTAAGAIRWSDGLALGAGAIVGGLIGAAVGRRLSAKTLERVAILVGVVATLSLILRRC